MRKVVIVLVLAACILLSWVPLGQSRPGEVPISTDFGPRSLSDQTGEGQGGPGGQGNSGQGNPGQGGPIDGQGQGPSNGAVRSNSVQDGAGEGAGGQGGRGKDEGTQVSPHRGDDPRPRNWGAPNARNETEFDDRKSPRKIAFVGKSANIRVYPNFSDTNVFLQLRFGRIVELDASGKPLPKHQVASLANAENAIDFTAGNRTIGSVNASFANVTLWPLAREEFRPCGGGGGSGGGGADSDRRPSAPPAPPAQLAPRMSVELLFGLDDAVTLPYGGINLTVPRNGLKWTISYANWPFCNDSNSLSVSLDLLLPANATAEVTTADGITSLTLRLGTEYNASLAFLGYALDGPDGSTKLPANVTVTQLQPDPEAAAAGGGSLVTIHTVLPNPKPLGVSTVWYDPTSATTSVYLAADDPGNAIIPATSSGNSSGPGSSPSPGGAAAGLRVTMWAALAAIMLSAFLMN